MHRLEQDEAGTFDLKAAGTVVGLIVAQVRLGETAIEAPEAHCGFIRVLVSGTFDWVENADCRQKRDSLARRRQELFNGFLMSTWFAQYLIFEHRKLIGTDNKSIASIDCDRFGLLTCQVTGQFFRAKALFVGFVDVRRDYLVMVQESIEEAAPIG